MHGPVVDYFLFENVLAGESCVAVLQELVDHEGH